MDVDPSIDSSQNSDLNTSDCIVISETDEPIAKAIVMNDTNSAVGKLLTTDIAETDADISTVTAGTSVIELDEKSEISDAETVSEIVLIENVSRAEPMSSMSSEKCEDADSIAIEVVNNLIESIAEVSDTEMRSVTPKGDDETDFIVVGTAINQEISAKEIGNPKIAESIIFLDTPEKEEQRPKSVNDKSIESDDDTPEKVADACIASLVQSVISMDTTEKTEQSFLTDVSESESEFLEIIGATSKTTPPVNVSSIMVDSEPVCIDGNIAEIAPEISAEKMESIVEESLKNKSDASKTIVESTKLDTTEDVKCTEQMLKKPEEVLTETTNTESNKSIELNIAEVDKNVGSDLKTLENVDFNENTPKLDEIDDDGSSENVISQVYDTIVAESGDATATTIDSIESKESDEPSKDNEKVDDTALLDEKCTNVEADALKKNIESEKNVAPAAIEDDVEEKLVKSNEKTDEIMETDAAVLPSTETDESIPMDIAESITPNKVGNGMDCEEEHETDDRAADESELKKTEENANDLEKSEEITAEPLDDETKPVSTTDADEQNALSTSTESETKTTPERAPVIRVKSMAFLCSDGKQF